MRSARRERRSSDGYQSDLAYVHGAGFTALASAAAATLLRLLLGRGAAPGLVVDVGCGTGELARRLTDAGWNVLGIDLSPAMVATARKRAPSATFRVGSLYRATLPRCRAVTAIGECLNYAFDGKGTTARLGAWFRRVHRALEPGGLLVFDVAEPGRGRAAGPQRHVLGDDWAVLVDSREDRRPPRLTRSITSFRRVGTRYRRTTEVHVLDLYPRGKIAELLRACGFSVRLGRGYGKSVLPAGHVTVIARKGRSEIAARRIR